MPGIGVGSPVGETGQGCGGRGVGTTVAVSVGLGGVGGLGGGLKHPASTTTATNNRRFIY
jgi:hypothetical protein